MNMWRFLWRVVYQVATVLVIEDALLIANLIKLALEKWGYSVVCAMNGQQGIECARRIKPDLIITDLRLPGTNLDGWTVIRLLRTEPAFQHTPIVVASVEINGDDRQRAFDAGCNAYISKPFRAHEIRDCVQSLIGAAM